MLNQGFHPFDDHLADCDPDTSALCYAQASTQVPMIMACPRDADSIETHWGLLTFSDLVLMLQELVR